MAAANAVLRRQGPFAGWTLVSGRFKKAPFLESHFTGETMAEFLGGVQATGFSTGGSGVLEELAKGASLLANARGSCIPARAEGR